MSELRVKVVDGDEGAEVRVKMFPYVASALAGVLAAEAARTGDAGWREAAAALTRAVRDCGKE